MVAPPRLSAPRTPSYLLPALLGLALFTFFFLYKVDDFATNTKTIAGHNLEPTPWHVFPAKSFDDETRHTRAYKIIQCSYLSCPYFNKTIPEPPRFSSSKPAAQCPEFFSYIHRDLAPWAKSGITEDHVMDAKNFAAFRIIIYQGKLYFDPYYACFQSRMMTTIWGFVQLLKKYPGMVPDVDLMFDCMDKPILNRTEHQSNPVPLFRYCTTREHFDIPFPDWSFWGWSEINIRPWSEEFPDIKKGSQDKRWAKRQPHAFWKGNPDVVSPVRLELLQCNDSRKWGAQIMRQDWVQEAREGFEASKLSNQCNYRYKIYAEGFAWSVSLKYILSCGSLTLIITPQYEDFFSRGLVPKKNYWPVAPFELCNSIKSAVDWGNSHQAEAQAIAKAGQDYMESLSMDRIYDYMFHLISEYSKLQKFKPVPPATALEVCPDSVLCFADEKQRIFLEKSTTSPSSEPPCNLPPAGDSNVQRWFDEKQRLQEEVRQMQPPLPQP
ncbi:O-glucosyltransferase rumi [Linum perenne]